MREPMASRAPDGVPRPRIMRVALTDLNAEIRRRRWQRRREAIVRIGIFLAAIVISIGLVLLAGRGSRR